MSSDFYLPPNPPRAKHTVSDPETIEEHLGQIWREGRWVDYARGTEISSRAWQAGDRSKRRVVHYISGEVLIGSQCPSRPLLPKNPASKGVHVDHLAPHEERLPSLLTRFSCDACGFKMVD